MRDIHEITFSEGTPQRIRHALYDAYVSGRRVKITYEQGYEDFTGYHDKTGLVKYCYVGCSTGSAPILLCIPSRRSCGGTGLLTSHIASVEVKR